MGELTFSVGDPAPDPRLLDMDGTEVLLSSAWADGPAVVVFLRYFGCPFCQAQVILLSEWRDRFAEAGAKVVLIGQGTRENARAFADAKRLPFRLLLDTQRDAYRAFGLTKASIAETFGPATALPWIAAQRHSETRQHGLQGGSFMQMPGTFVVGRDGRFVLVHRHRHVADYPPIGKLMAAVTAAGPR